ncbi:biotin/lipoyl-containing protein [Saccharicrinis sp. FJH54]|uniref:biotin/lipoyl-containing protein n=1 Tax=Saccharicrinis sp. FJH54 TaxID=3344665 RepID=UPI0035D46FA5
MEVKINNEILDVKILSIKGNMATISVDDREYEIDITMVERGVYSLLHKNNSYNVELIHGNESRKYMVNTQHKSYNVEIVDAQTKYRENRNNNQGIDGAGSVSSPMPGRVVRLLVKKGDKVKVGQPVIIVSAMKMESEYKSGIDGEVKKILVKEGQTIEGHQTLLEIE